MIKITQRTINAITAVILLILACILIPIYFGGCTMRETPLGFEIATTTADTITIVGPGVTTIILEPDTTNE